jgi:hypothetical protein
MPEEPEFTAYSIADTIDLQNIGIELVVTEIYEDVVIIV